MYKRSELRRTGLKQKLVWYRDNYGLSLSTVQRYRDYLDHPESLVMMLDSSPGRECDLTKLFKFLEEQEKRKS